MGQEWDLVPTSTKIKDYYRIVVVQVMDTFGLAREAKNARTLLRNIQEVLVSFVEIFAKKVSPWVKAKVPWGECLENSTIASVMPKKISMTLHNRGPNSSVMLWPRGHGLDLKGHLKSGMSLVPNFEELKEKCPLCSYWGLGTLRSPFEVLACMQEPLQVAKC